MNATTYATKVYWKSSSQEYVVKLFKNGQHVKAADYHTPDRDDAYHTSEAMYYHAVENQT